MIVLDWDCVCFVCCFVSVQVSDDAQEEKEKECLQWIE